MTDVPKFIPTVSIEVKVDNGDEVANFIGALTYTTTRSRAIHFGTDGTFDLGNISYDEEFTTSAYMFSMPDGKAIRVEVGKVLIKPDHQYRDALFVGPQTGD